MTDYLREATSRLIDAGNNVAAIGQELNANAKRPGGVPTDVVIQLTRTQIELAQAWICLARALAR